MRTRPFAAAALAAAAVLAPAAVPAAAHGDTVHLEVAGQEGGHVTAVATWENDHDPVTEEFAGTLSATSADGRTAGPWRLVAVPGRPGAYTTRELLPAGHWRITVDCAFPSLGHGERELDVEAAVISDPTLPVPTGSPAAAPTTAPTAATVPAPPASATPVTPASATPVTSAVLPERHDAANPADAAGASDAATWAAVGTAAAAVVLVATGFRLRRRARRS
ncbi:hypothetical protein PUR61_23275 [Streptomyces sp. BE20]|uniref:hypothetical protein n=1 Tax=Streptomyces sp. BE20 TaxID=3002525 RepID=UPI002E79C82F|nr:hypothetical protein [Streptomyces sp. BE20]MEE1825081.1 hypothetical protein [Streptomyces sp. BE20]